MLIAWTEVTSGAPELEEEKVCGSSVTPVVAGSPEGRFESLGNVSGPSGMSAPQGVAIDQAGAGWVIGVHNGITGANHYGLEWEWTSAWAAFRPAGESLQSAIKLPAKGVMFEKPRVAENASGVALLAWSTERGTYLAWGDPDGKITPPQFLAQLHVVAIGVDEHGAAHAIGYYGSPKAFVTKSIVAVSAGQYSVFARPHVIAVEPHRVHGKAAVSFGRPFAVFGPTGAAVIVWESLYSVPPPEAPAGPGLLVERQADGHFTPPRSLSKEFLGYELKTDPAFATVDAAGQTLIVHEVNGSWHELDTLASGRPSAERVLPAVEVDPLGLAGNELGETAIVIGQRNRIVALLGGSFGAPPTTQTIPTPNEDSPAPVVTIDGDGHATAVWIEKPQENITLVNAQAISLGAQTIQIARGELTNYQG
jgi:hypothetical protein